MRYPVIVRRSAELYLAHLRRTLPEGAPPIQEAIRKLIAALELALESGPQSDPAGFDFGADTLRAADLSPADCQRLVNQFLLGTGDDAARVIAMGTEDGYASNGLDLAVWNCTCAVLWLTGSPLPVLQRFARGMPDEEDSLWPGPQDPDLQEYRPYHTHPNLWAHIQGKLRGGQTTYGVLTYLVGAPDPVALDDHCYQIERSAAPAKQSIDGRDVTEERIDFLVEALQAMRQTACLLILHGRVRLEDLPQVADGDRWDQANRRLTSAFLGTEGLPEGQAWSVGGGRRIYRARVFRAGKHTVLWMWAPGARLREEYKKRLREVVQNALAGSA